MSILKKALNFVKENVLFLMTLFLIVFIPLVPKIPIININNTWVYVRTEDFVVLFVLLFWVSLLYRKKITFDTPLTLQIIIYWLIGAVATIHGILFVFPYLANVFANVAFLSFLRHIEYLSLFFIAYHSLKEKRLIPVVVSTIIATLISVSLYGLGQKYLGFPAFLTSNEEFAKGTPIYLSELSRVPSTFAGHYDFAAYLVLMIPIAVSMIFGFKNIFARLILISASLLGFLLLFMTVSRVSFFVLFFVLFIVIFFQKRKLILLLIPFFVAAIILILSFQSSLLDRFQSTVSDTDVLVNAETGEALGNIKYVEPAFFEDKIVLQKIIRSQYDLQQALDKEQQQQQSSESAVIFPLERVPDRAVVLTPSNLSTGETLPQGTGYTNLALSPVVHKSTIFFYEFPPETKAKTGGDFLALNGIYIVKKASAYDLSFTTRFQGEWPRAIDAFKRNIFLGSGYGSVGLAMDNNYLRILGEVGLLGFAAFLSIFLTLGIYIKKIWKDIDSNVAKSFIIGFSAGIIGLALNATLIDVFEASKIAFTLWLLMGVIFAVLKFYQKKQIDLFLEFKEFATSRLAIFVYLFAFAWLFFSPMLTSFFVADDFTWFRWAADNNFNLLSYFTSSDGFFYRPGTKLFFHLMYNIFWLNQAVYHLVSLAAHFLVAYLFFLLLMKIFKSKMVSFLAALFFLIGSGSLESVYWISSTGHLFAAFFGLLGLLLFINYEENKKKILYLLSFISFSLSLLFHEFAVILPLLILAYKVKDNGIRNSLSIIKRVDFLLLFASTFIYLMLRLSANSHWFAGDYNYNLLKLPFNLVGNIFGYVFLTVLGPLFIPIYEITRNFARENLLFSLITVGLAVIASLALYKLYQRGFDKRERNTVLFGVFFFLFSLLPYLGLGNITSRYSYLASMGVIVIIVVLAKKLYEHLTIHGRQVSSLLGALLILTYFLFQIIWLQQVYSSWNGAGVKSKNFFVSIDSLYLNSWAKDSIDLHFVDVPLKYGHAWVWPVGLEDAVWISFRNPNARVQIHSSLEEARQATDVTCKNRILIFQDDGSVKDDQPNKLIRCQ
jgi:hypothetical protein